MTQKTSGAPDRQTPSIARTALRLLPLQVVFRGGEALLPLVLAAWFGRTAETDLYYVLATYFVFAGAVLTGAFQDSGAVPVLIELRSNDPERLPQVAASLLGHTLAIGSAVGVAMGLLAAVAVGMTSSTPRLGLELVLLMSVGMVANTVRAFYVGFLNASGIFHAHPVGSVVGLGVTRILLAVGRDALGVRIIPLALLAAVLVAIAILSTLVSGGLRLRVSLNLLRPV